MGVLRGRLSNCRFSVCSPYPGCLDIPQFKQRQYEDDLGLHVQYNISLQAGYIISVSEHSFADR